MKIIKYLTLFLLSIIYCSCSQKAENDKIDKVENNVTCKGQHYNIYERMKFYKVPSISIAVINDGKIEWAKAYGLADLESKKNADINTLYQAASISKSINALCIMKLVEEGKLSLDTDIRKYLKTWTLPDNEFSKDKTITLRSLLSHSAGMDVHGFAGYTINDSIPSINEILDGKLPANNNAIRAFINPNTKVEYSGGGIVITRKIIEDNINSNYDKLLNDLVFVPLKMTNSTFTLSPKTTKYNLATGYDTIAKEILGKYHLYPEKSPDGLWSTPTDLAKFILSVQQSLKTNSSFLNTKIANEMLSPVLDSSKAALGCFIETYGGEKYFCHGGSNEGFNCCYYGSFSNGVGVVIMANSDNSDLIYEILEGVASVYGWKEFVIPE